LIIRQQFRASIEERIGNVPPYGSIPKHGATDTMGRAGDAFASSVTRATSDFAKRVTATTHLLALAWREQ